ncbi:MAG: triose-phosphate isomerase [Candidatus Wildermuthbacteria bacterium]|nr:triose-phosphate isomerase [Candidatus Wildermuthbacteria bacterium]
MHPQNSKDAFDLVSAVKKGIASLDADVVVCPPFIYLSQFLPSDNLFIGAQDCAWEQDGPYTGAISPAMLKNMGCSHVIIGHSERKAHFGETQDMIQKKVQAALTAHVIPVACIGSSAQEELAGILKVLQPEQVSHVVFAYEPEWAISTSANAKPETPEHAKEIMDQMRKDIEAYAGKEKANDTRIIYGGSVNSKDVKSFLDAGAQGVLVGSSSLDAQEFIDLVKNAVLR